MKIVGINGSHRPRKGTAALMQAALDAAGHRGVEVQAIELADLDIGFCVGCNACLGCTRCSLRDDMDVLYDAMRDADGIVLATPDYFGNVSARMKNFMDRTRPFHMVENVLKGKVGGAVATAGLDNCGVEAAMGALDAWFATHEMLSVHPRPMGPVLGSGPTATGFDGLDTEGRPLWRSVKADSAAFDCARQLGCDMVDLLDRLHA